MHAHVVNAVAAAAAANFRRSTLLRAMTSSASQPPSSCSAYDTDAATIGRMLCRAYAAGVAAVNPEALIRRSVCVDLLPPDHPDKTDGPRGLRLRIRTREQPDAAEFLVCGGVGLVAFGKAAAGMARGLLSNQPAEFAQRVRGGVVVVPAATAEERRAGLGFEVPADVADSLGNRIQLFEGPRDNLPDETVLRGSDAAARLIDSLGPDDLLVAMVTGGGSAMLAWPRLPLSDYRATIRLLSGSGFSIAELNAIRRRLDAVKAGGLAAKCRCRLVGLVLSDVVGDPLEVIASGPTVPPTQEAAAQDASIVAASLSSLAQRKLDGRLPQAALRLLNEAQLLPPPSHSVANFIVGNNRTALEAARLEFLTLATTGPDATRTQRAAAVVMTTELVGDVAAVAKRVHAWLTALDRMLAVEESDGMVVDVSDIVGLMEGDSARLATAVADWRTVGGGIGGGCIALLAGGEPTVDTTVGVGVGVGGRAGHLALLLAEQLSRWPGRSRPSVLAAGTDGIDGPTDAAGGLVDAGTWHQAVGLLGEDRCRAALTGFDSHSLLGQLEGVDGLGVPLPALFRPGLTGTNVMDLVIAVLSVPPR